MSNVITLAVPGISCGECRLVIGGAVAAVTGVSAAQVDLEARTVGIAYRASAALPRIVTAIEESGYQISGFEVANQPMRRAS
ncbi:heavy-metal-associated domain-containing protein [Streptomyces lavendulocolor]|uniref:heavy-metal-associated domain-containing protein n=1 Tax=Streptomyces lavendulocolor TaxID=67316 RepID=UPI0033CA0908